MSLRVAPPLGGPEAEEDEHVKLPQALEMAFAFKSERARVLGREDGDVPEDELGGEADEYGADEDGGPNSLSAKEKLRQKNKNKKKKKKKKKMQRAEEKSKENEENEGDENEKEKEKEKDKDEVNVEVEYVV
jgi:hypothetical protein